MQPNGDIPIIVNQDVKTPLDYSQPAVDPDIWTDVDACGKSLYSTVLADLGQSSGPNLLSKPDLLSQYTQNFKPNSTANAKAGPATSSYDELRAQTGPLAIVPSTIYQQYICQVPVRKSIGSLIITVTVANLVFLQALWKICTLGATKYANVKDKTAMYCAGCESLT